MTVEQITSIQEPRATAYITLKRSHCIGFNFRTLVAFYHISGITNATGIFAVGHGNKLVIELEFEKFQSPSMYMVAILKVLKEIGYGFEYFYMQSNLDSPYLLLTLNKEK